MKNKVLLLDLPTYPKGVLALSLLSVASCLKNDFDVRLIDLNIEEFNLDSLNDHQSALIGMKVSAQNSEIAKSLTAKIKSIDTSIQVFWGGEFPTLLPEEAIEVADFIFCGLFETAYPIFLSDFKNGSIKRMYKAKVDYSMDIIPLPDFSFISDLSAYSSFMGLPMETSRGCKEKCTFCMVHTMQKKNYYLKSSEQLKSEISSFDCSFINIIDYNFGVDKYHMLRTAEIIKGSGALGWMAEMCIELLDDDVLLQALSASRCRMIYCGLESIDDQALQSVHKMNTNHINNYERIIRKVQSYGIQIAAGMILGIANTSETTFEKTLDFFQKMGLIYVKLTFLTYNPGTKVQKYMLKKGIYTTDKTEEFDGVRMSYLPHGTDKNIVITGAEYFIKKFYNIPAIIKRSFNTKLNMIGRIEFILFSYCYGRVYREWLANGFLRKPEQFETLLSARFKKTISISWAERMLLIARRSRYNSLF